MGDSIHVGIDVGGTFTDITVHVPGRSDPVLFKLASTPGAPDEAVVEGVGKVLAEHGIEPGDVARISHGTTVGTNALIERKVGKIALVTTRGFRDLLEIGRQTRPRVYDVHLDHPPPLVPRELRLEVSERLLADGRVYKPLDEGELELAAQVLTDARVDGVVVGFLNAYAHPDHEVRAAEFLRQRLPPTVDVQYSAAIYPEFREYERFSTAVINAALVTVMKAYLERFQRGVAGLGIPAEPEVSQSVGGLMSIPMAQAVPLRASLSGPAAGVIGTAARAARAGLDDVITLDMGGTSADVSLLIGGKPTEVQDRMLAGFPLRMPALDVNAVGAGGGSIAWIDRDGLLKVGPHSAGAHPGPACYGQGGTAATVTDANVVLGRLNPDALLDGRMPIDAGLARDALGVLAEQLRLGIDETALGIVQVTTAVMVKAIRAISVERGHDPTTFTLFAFGGAGPLHAVDVARELDIGTVMVPPNPGLLCAEGLLHSHLRADFVNTLLQTLTPESLPEIRAGRAELERRCREWFDTERVPPADRSVSWSADLRYVGQNFELTIGLDDLWDATGGLDEAVSRSISAAFHAAHDFAYGFASPQEPIEWVSLRATTVGRMPTPELSPGTRGSPGRPKGRRRTGFAAPDGSVRHHDTAVYARADLVVGQVLTGPAVIEQLDTTVVVHPGDRATTDAWGNLVIELEPGHEI